MKTKNLMVFALVLVALFITPLVSADIIMPGYKTILINNKITNINDFPDYVFISATNEKFGPGLGMCPVEVIEEDGEIPSYYKHCDISVYAINKAEFDINYVISLNETKLNEYFLSSDVKEVIRGVRSSMLVPITSSKESMDNYYTIDLTTINENPDSVIENNSFVYIYIVCSIIALLIIIFIIIKKRVKRIRK